MANNDNEVNKNIDALVKFYQAVLGDEKTLDGALTSLITGSTAGSEPAISKVLLKALKKFYDLADDDDNDAFFEKVKKNKPKNITKKNFDESQPVADQKVNILKMLNEINPPDNNTDKWEDLLKIIDVKKDELDNILQKNPGTQPNANTVGLNNGDKDNSDQPEQSLPIFRPSAFLAAVYDAAQKDDESILNNLIKCYSSNLNRDIDRDIDSLLGNLKLFYGLHENDDNEKLIQTVREKLKNQKNVKFDQTDAENNTHTLQMLRERYNNILDKNSNSNAVESGHQIFNSIQMGDGDIEEILKDKLGYSDNLPPKILKNLKDFLNVPEDYPICTVLKAEDLNFSDTDNVQTKKAKFKKCIMSSISNPNAGQGLTDLEKLKSSTSCNKKYTPFIEAIAELMGKDKEVSLEPIITPIAFKEKVDKKTEFYTGRELNGNYKFNIDIYPRLQKINDTIPENFDFEPFNLGIGESGAIRDLKQLTRLVNHIRNKTFKIQDLPKQLQNDLTNIFGDEPEKKINEFPQLGVSMMFHKKIGEEQIKKVLKNIKVDHANFDLIKRLNETRFENTLLKKCKDKVIKLLGDNTLFPNLQGNKEEIIDSLVAIGFPSNKDIHNSTAEQIKTEIKKDFDNYVLKELAKNSTSNMTKHYKNLNPIVDATATATATATALINPTNSYSEAFNDEINKLLGTDNSLKLNMANSEDRYVSTIMGYHGVKIEGGQFSSKSGDLPEDSIFKMEPNVLIPLLKKLSKFELFDNQISKLDTVDNVRKAIIISLNRSGNILSKDQEAALKELNSVLFKASPIQFGLEIISKENLVDAINTIQRKKEPLDGSSMDLSKDIDPNLLRDLKLIFNASSDKQLNHMIREAFNKEVVNSESLKPMLKSIGNSAKAFDEKTVKAVLLKKISYSDDNYQLALKLDRIFGSTEFVRGFNERNIQGRLDIRNKISKSLDENNIKDIKDTATALFEIQRLKEKTTDPTEQNKLKIIERKIENKDLLRRYEERLEKAKEGFKKSLNPQTTASKDIKGELESISNFAFLAHYKDFLKHSDESKFDKSLVDSLKESLKNCKFEDLNPPKLTPEELYEQFKDKDKDKIDDTFIASFNKAFHEVLGERTTNMNAMRDRMIPPEVVNAANHCYEYMSQKKFNDSVLKNVNDVSKEYTSIKVPNNYEFKGLVKSIDTGANAIVNINPTGGEANPIFLDSKNGLEMNYGGGTMKINVDDTTKNICYSTDSSKETAGSRDRNNWWAKKTLGKTYKISKLENILQNDDATKDGIYSIALSYLLNWKPGDQPKFRTESPEEMKILLMNIYLISRQLEKKIPAFQNFPYDQIKMEIKNENAGKCQEIKEQFLAYQKWTHNPFYKPVSVSEHFTSHGEFKILREKLRLNPKQKEDLEKLAEDKYNDLLLQDYKKLIAVGLKDSNKENQKEINNDIENVLNSSQFKDKLKQYVKYEGTLPLERYKDKTVKTNELNDELNKIYNNINKKL